MFLQKRIQRRHTALLQKMAAQQILLTQKIDSFKFSQPERAATIETKKHTIERTLQQITQTLSENAAAQELAITLKKLSDVELLFESLMTDIEPGKNNLKKLFFTLFLIILLIKPFIFSTYDVTDGGCEPTLLVGDTAVINKLAYVYASIKRKDLVLLEQLSKEDSKTNTFKRWWEKYIGIKVDFFDLPEHRKLTIQRIIAVPGDTIEGRIENNVPVIYVNGEKLTEWYINQYPLIGLSNNKILVEEKSPFAHIIPQSAINKNSNLSIRWASFDPNQSIKTQPFYKINESEILTHSKTNLPMFKHPQIAESCDIFFKETIPQNFYWCMNDNRRMTSDSRTFGLIRSDQIYGNVYRILYSIDSYEYSWLLEIIKNPKSFFSHQMRTNRFLAKI